MTPLRGSGNPMERFVVDIQKAQLQNLRFGLELALPKGRGAVE
jgi:hypothetical protein